MKKDIKDILLPLKSHLVKVESEIVKKVTTGVSIIDESSIHIVSSGGKRIRAALVLISSGLKGEIPSDIETLAASAEIVHAATLVHDDIIDQAFLRRGNVTVSEKWGNKVAVLVGDYMYTMALDIAAKESNPAMFPVMVEGTGAMVRGELLQMEYSNFSSITLEKYNEIIEHKTARFMGTCTRLGAMKSGFSQKECDDLYEFGLNLGFAFQIVDDTIDFSDDELKTGKDIGNDFLDGKVTLPMLYMLENTSDKERNSILEKLENPLKENWPDVQKKVIECGAVDYSMKTAEGYIKKSLTYIESFQKTPYRTMLYEIADFFLNRQY